MVKHKRARVAVGLLVWMLVFGGCAVSQADVIFQIRASDTELPVGGQVSLGIYAYIADSQPGAGDGIHVWQLDVIVPTAEDGILAVLDEPVSQVIKAPVPFLATDTGWESINVDPDDAGISRTGYVKWLTASPEDINQPSTVGEGDFDLIAELTLTGLAPGTVHFSLGESMGGGFFAITRDGEFLPGVFDATGSDTDFTVLSVPEPGGMILLAGAAVWGWCRRRRH